VRSATDTLSRLNLARAPQTRPRRMRLKNGCDRPACLCSFVEKQILNRPGNQFHCSDSFGSPIKLFSPPRASSSANSFRKRKKGSRGQRPERAGKRIQHRKWICCLQSGENPTGPRDYKDADLTGEEEAFHRAHFYTYVQSPFVCLST
jgi:hypothetical protein